MRGPLVLVSGLATGLAFFAVFSAVGCSSSSGNGSAAGGVDVDASACALGFAALGDAGGCTPILPASVCAPGSSPTIGSATCAPVGVPQCPAGFVVSSSGWGCDAVVPATVCTGATRDAVGSDTCVPVGDCNAAFPPAGATLFVDAAFTPGQIDATHFTTVSAALLSAPMNAVIAVESGTYTEQLTLASPVTIVGRCAEKVIFQPADAAKSAISLDSNYKVKASGLTVRGFHSAVGITAGDLTLDSVIVENSHFAGIVVGNVHTLVTLNDVVVRGTRASTTDANSFGLYIGDGAKVVVTNSAFADNDYINVGVSGDGQRGADLELSGSVVRNGHKFGAAGGFGWGIYGSNQVTINVDTSALVDNQGFGMILNSTTTKTSAVGKITGSVVRGTTLDPVNGQGMGIESNKSNIDIEQTTIADSNMFDVYVADSQTKIVGSTLLGTSNPDPTQLGPIGMNLSGSATTIQSTSIVDTRAAIQFEGATVAEMDDSIVFGTRSNDKGYYPDTNYAGVGLFVESAAQLTAKNVAIINAHTAGLITLGQTTATGLLIEGTRGGGDGVGGRAVSAQGGAVVSISGSAFVDNIESGVIAAGQSSLTMTDSTIDQTALDQSSQYGIGILLADQALGTISTTTLRRGQGPGLAVSGSGGTLTRCAVLDNSIGVAVQGGSFLVEGTGTGDPHTVAISSDTVFAGNATRVGSGDVPIPTALVTPKK